MSDLYDKQEFQRVGNYLLDVVAPLYKELGLTESARDVRLVAIEMMSDTLAWYVDHPLNKG
jgi:hypothetical protein